MNYDKIADKYDLLFNDKESLDENNKVKKIIEKNIFGDVLDIGCGTGLLLELIKIEPKNYIGIDPSFKMISRLIDKHKEYKNCIINKKFEENNFDRKFDTIISLFGSPSYLDESSREKIFDLLKDNGRYFLMYYNNDYYPKTYKLTGVRFKYFKNKEFKNGKTIRFNNYTINTNYENI